MTDIEDIVKDYYYHIYNFALKLTCHPQDAQDITQDTFLKAWKKQDDLRKEEALGKWLRSICYREFLMKVRKDKKIETVVDDWEDLERDGQLLEKRAPLPEDEVVVDEEIRELQNGCFLAMVRKLSLHQRIAFSLVDMFGMKVEEVADLLGVTKGAVKGLLFRGRMNIDSFFADHCNLLYEKNPCSCQAWIRFSENREKMQKRVKELSAKLDYGEKGYYYNEEVRRKILYLYRNMPEKKPPQEWYEEIMEAMHV